MFRRRIRIVGDFPYTDVGYNRATMTAAGTCIGSLTVVLDGEPTLSTQSAEYKVTATASPNTSSASGEFTIAATFQTPPATLDARLIFGGPATYQQNWPFAVAWKVPCHARGTVKVGSRRREFFAVSGTADGDSISAGPDVKDKMKIRLSKMELEGTTRFRWWLPWG